MNGDLAGKSGRGAHGPTAFVNVHVVPMDSERLLENQTVLVEGELIAAIGPVDEIQVPPDAHVVEGKGAYLMPGLADMHMHFVSIGQTFAGPEQLPLFLAQGVTTIRNLSALPEHMQWKEAVASGERIGPTLYNGRMVVNLPPPLAGLRTRFRALLVLIPVLTGLIAWLLLWLGLILTGNDALFQQISVALLPTLALLLLVGALTAYFKLIPFSSYVALYYPFATVPETEEEARRFVREIKEEGYDFVKPYDWLDREVYLATIDEARQQGKYTVGHLLDELAGELDLILRTGLREVAHMDEFTDGHMTGEPSPTQGFNEVGFDYRLIPQTAASIKAHGVMVVSNLVADEVIYQALEDVDGVLSQPAYDVVSPKVVEAWKREGRLVERQGQQSWRRQVQMPFLLALTKALHEAGVPLLIGTDIPVEGMLPAHVHRDLELLVEAGLTPFEALEAGTKNAGLSVARMGYDGRFGTVAVGQRADLLLLPANPLENVSRTRERLGLMVRGRWFTQAELDRLVEAYVTSYRAVDSWGAAG